MSFILAKNPGNLKSEALLRVEDFPASYTQIYLICLAMHDMRMQASRFGVLSSITWIELFVSPSMQLANCRAFCGIRKYRHVSHGAVESSA
jgi:hypothetical protein